MTPPDRNNPYSFDEYIEWRRNVDYYRDDPFIQKGVKSICGELWEEVDSAARQISPKVSFDWRDMSQAIARPENRPYIQHYDAHRHRIDRIVRPAQILTMEKEVFAEALFSDRTHPWTKLVKMYLIYQNGEACTSCPLVCTEGLVAVLEKFADTPELRRILTHCKEGIDGDFGMGAQFISEAQGGSDIPSNLLEAVETDGNWRLYGNKFFCSATHADYAVVTAKPAGSDTVAMFVVPSWLPGDKVREQRNHITIDRLKWKMGTSELPTAEMTFNGAAAYPVGPLERGVANVVGIVLTLSRLTVGLSGAAVMTRAAREALKYAEFRQAFGQPIGQFPMLAGQLDWIAASARRTTAGAFKLYREFLQLEGGLKGGLAFDEKNEQMNKRRFDVRELIMLQKIAASWDATDVLRAAMSVLGGHGVIEDFSDLPRLFRDAAINELWEGPRNVLLTQIYRDLQRVREWYPPAEFVNRILSGADASVIRQASEEITELILHADLFRPGERAKEICARWDKFCHRLVHDYQDLAAAEIEAGNT